MGNNQDLSENIVNYFSLVELLEKLGKEKVSALVSKGRPKKIVQGEMIYFLKSDIIRIMQEFLPTDLELIGVSPALNDESMELLVDGVFSESVESARDVLHYFVFKETFIRRLEQNNDEIIYEDQELNLEQEIFYGRINGNEAIQKEFHGHKIISSLHGRLFLDEDGNLMYQDIGVNKSKVRGCKDKNYQTLAQNEIGVLVNREIFEQVLHKQKVVLIASIKIGWQAKPHYIIRIKILKKDL